MKVPSLMIKKSFLKKKNIEKKKHKKITPKILVYFVARKNKWSYAIFSYDTLK